VTGYVVADNLDKYPENLEKIRSLKAEEMYAMDWTTLFDSAISSWREFLETLVGRAPDDHRLKALLTG
jgi:hypothetical protein